MVTNEFSFFSALYFANKAITTVVTRQVWDQQIAWIWRNYLMNFSILTGRFKVLFLRRGISSMYIYTTARVLEISVSISSVNNMINLSLCLMTNYYFYIYTAIKNCFSSSHAILFKSVIFCKGIMTKFRALTN
jgi:hypothetical protein